MDIIRKTQWQLQDAKAQLNQVVEVALQDEPRHVTRRGQEAMVVLSEVSHRVLREGTRASGPSFITHLLTVPKEGASAGKQSRLDLRDIDL